MNFFNTTGYSMWPFLKQGERVIVKKVPLEELKIGDIILYRENGQLVCHRLVKKIRSRDRHLLYARGDNSLSSSSLVEEGSYEGRAAGVLKNGKIIDLVNTRQFFINRSIVIIAPLISRFINLIRPFYNKLKQNFTIR